MTKIFCFNKEFVREFEVTEEFTEIFGEAEKISGVAVKPANIDCLFDNFIEKDETLYCLDCEWVVDALVPVEYLKYRSLFYFYRKFKMYLEKYMSEEEFLEAFEITMEKSDIYFEMEDQLSALHSWTKS
jgi:O-antigen biosynthesis protein